MRFVKMARIQSVMCRLKASIPIMMVTVRSARSMKPTLQLSMTVSARART